MSPPALLLSGTALSLALAANSAWALDSRQATSDAALKEPIALYETGDWKAAQARFESIIAKPGAASGTSELARYYKALCLQQQRQYNAARSEYTFLYKNGKDQAVRYKAWTALNSLARVKQQIATQKDRVAKSGAQTTAKNGPGSDVWITPKEGDGRSGPEASSSVSVTVIPTSCGRRGR